MTLKLFELVGTDEARPFSPFCWRTRMARAHKGMSAQSIDDMARKSPGYPV